MANAAADEQQTQLNDLRDLGMAEFLKRLDEMHGNLRVKDSHFERIFNSEYVQSLPEVQKWREKHER